MNIFNTLVKGVGGADMAVIGAAAVSVVVDTVKTGIVEHACLFFR